MVRRGGAGAGEDERLCLAEVVLELGVLRTDGRLDDGGTDGKAIEATARCPVGVVSDESAASVNVDAGSGVGGSVFDVVMAGMGCAFERRLGSGTEEGESETDSDEVAVCVLDEGEEDEGSAVTVCGCDKGGISLSLSAAVAPPALPAESGFMLRR